jgi:hypothetical protein
MNEDSDYQLRKRIKELERENRELTNDLYDYKTTVKEIFDGVVEVVGNGTTNIKCSWLLSKIRRCLK